MRMNVSAAVAVAAAALHECWKIVEQTRNCCNEWLLVCRFTMQYIDIGRFPIFLHLLLKLKISIYNAKNLSSAPDHKALTHTHLQSVCACIGVWWLWNEFTAMFSDCCIFRTPFREPHHRAIIIRKFHSIFYSFRFFNQHESRTICFLNRNLEKNVSVEVLFSTVNFMFTTKHTRWHKHCKPNAYKAIFMKKKLES